jgi:hypothetical protein
MIHILNTLLLFLALFLSPIFISSLITLFTDVKSPKAFYIAHAAFLSFVFTSAFYSSLSHLQPHQNLSTFSSVPQYLLSLTVSSFISWIIYNIMDLIKGCNPLLPRKSSVA